MKRIMAVAVLCSFLSMGCQATHQAAEEIGKPIGAASKSLGGVTEGAAEAYGDWETDNPFNR